MISMDRYRFIRVAAGCLLLGSTGIFAQTLPRQPVRIAVLSPGSNEARSVFTAFRTRLRALGYEEGRDLALVFYFAKGLDALEPLARVIARESFDVVLADGRFAAQAMHSISRTIPIVAVAGEPVASGLAASLARPGSNVTGVSTMSVDLGRKGIEIMREILPGARRIGIIGPSVLPPPTYRALEAGAAALKVKLRHIIIRTEVDAERELAPAAIANVDGLVLPANAIIGGLIATLIRLINAAAKPAIFGDRDSVAGGGLAFYGFDIDEAFRLCATVVDRLLKGANPATTPFEQPTRIALVLNLQTARTLNLKFPPSLIARADELIQ